MEEGAPVLYSVRRYASQQGHDFIGSRCPNLYWNVFSKPSVDCPNMTTSAEQAIGVGSLELSRDHVVPLLRNSAPIFPEFYL